MNFIWSKLSWKGDYLCACPLCFANQWIVQDIPSLSSQSECAKMDIHWFGIYICDQVVSGPFRMDHEGRRKRGESVELSKHNSAGRTPGQN